MSLPARLLVCAALVTAVSGTAHAAVIWRGDFTTGDISQWTSTESVGSDRLQVTKDPMDPNQFALQTTVKQGDNPTHSAGGNRNELTYEADRPAEGDERYYRWQTMWPADYQTDNYWQIFTQWHQYVSGGSPPLAFMAWGEQIKLGNNQDTYFWTAPLERGRWHDFVFHVIWSSDSSVGGIELWYDGNHALPFTNVATLFPHDTVYTKQGLYRKDRIQQDQVIYDRGMTIATSLADVMPATPPATTPASTTPPATTPASTSTSSLTTGSPTPTTTSSQSGGLVEQGIVVKSRAGGCQSASPASALLACIAGVFLWRRRAKTSTDPITRQMIGGPVRSPVRVEASRMASRDASDRARGRTPRSRS
jgi:hypothetical protein